MKREIYLVENFYRLDELLFQLNDAAQTGGPLAVGFYKARKANAPGVEISVTPQFLRPHILTLVEDGQFSPLESGLFLWAGPEAANDLPWQLSRGTNSKQSPLSRWLLLGLNSTGVGQSGLQVAIDPLSAVEHIREFLTKLFRNVLELRPSVVVFLFDVSAFSFHLQQSGVRVDENEVFNEVLSWLVEDCIHPKLAIVFKNENDFKRASQRSHGMVTKSHIARDVTFAF